MRSIKLGCEKNLINLPFISEEHSICVTLMEKLLEKEAPLVTTVSVIGALVASPMSMYTARITDELKILT